MDYEVEIITTIIPQIYIDKLKNIGIDANVYDWMTPNEFYEKYEYSTRSGPNVYWFKEECNYIGCNSFGVIFNHISSGNYFPKIMFLTEIPVVQNW